MKKYTITNRMSKEAKAAILDTIKTNQINSNAYFKSPATSANQRRQKELFFASNHPEYTLIKGNQEINVKMEYRQSCKNVYYRLLVHVNGEKKNVNVLKKLLENK